MSNIEYIFYIAYPVCDKRDTHGWGEARPA